MEAIERHLGARRGREHVLSPRDFALARSWYRAGIPLTTVLAGMDRAFDSGASVSSLAYCQRQVEELVATGPGRTTAVARVEGTARAEIAGRLRSLLDRIDGLEPGARAFFEGVRDRIGAPREKEPGGPHLLRELDEIDERVSAAALRALPAEVAAAHAAEAARAVERQRGRVGEEALADAWSRFRVQKAREYFHLPLVSALGEALEPGGSEEPGRD